ncbi:hypothetical protein EUX98_g7847 [Antrodiella citrinella]|uniref:BTB domain-containing protein n=1 Tax=Antrodiella citrinella TaxID=2447956 RepID=A0A4S4MSK9_9APHY|nr:hypothetical protein EUX98_g7847 [Antrodiella citrinella]
MSSDEPTTQDPSPTPTSIPKSSALTPHPDFFFEDLYIAIEDHLFKVPRRTFENSSDVFCDMFAVPVPGGQPADGSCTEHPLLLTGATTEEFVQLLKVLTYDEPSELSPTEWEGALKLANLWQFTRVRDNAIMALQPIVYKLSAVEIILKARQYDVNEWLTAAVCTMARRAGAVSKEDAQVIGIDDALKIAQVREEALDIVVEKHGRFFIDFKKRDAVDYVPTIERIFGIQEPE